MTRTRVTEIQVTRVRMAGHGMTLQGVTRAEVSWMQVNPDSDGSDSNKRNVYLSIYLSVRVCVFVLCLVRVLCVCVVCVKYRSVPASSAWMQSCIPHPSKVQACNPDSDK